MIATARQGRSSSRRTLPQACTALLVSLIYLTLPLAAQKPQTLPDKEARAAVKSFKAGLKKAKSNLRARLQLVETLGAQSSEKFIRPLQSLLRKERQLTVRKAIAAALGNQPGKKARVALFQIYDKLDSKADPAFAASLVRAISKQHFTPRDWPRLQKTFNKVIWLATATDLQSAIIEVAGQHKIHDAVRFLAEHIDAPAPVDVDDPANPPASYWKIRWENWQGWKAKVAASLKAITGESLETKKATIKWLRENPRSTTRKPKRKRR